jgi:membrane-bound inhibitor of C-type lysozyme
MDDTSKVHDSEALKQIIYTFSGGKALTGTPVYTASATADVTFSDTFQSTTKFNTPVLTETDGGTGNGQIGVIPFVWSKGPRGDVPQTNYDRLTNITAQQAKALLGSTSGYVPLSLFTGNSADAGYYVIAAGRNDDSGTRFGAFAECGFGQANTPQQWNLTVNATNVTAVSLNTLFTDGYSSGGTMTKAVNLAPASGLKVNGNPFIVVTYSGVADAKNINGGASVLTYNGYGTTTVAPDFITAGLGAKIQDGQYSFWEFEHIYYRSTFAGVAKNATELIAAQIASTDAIASGLLNDIGGAMWAGRNDENSPVFSYR